MKEVHIKYSDFGGHALYDDATRIHLAHNPHVHWNLKKVFPSDLEQQVAIQDAMELMRIHMEKVLKGDRHG